MSLLVYLASHTYEECPISENKKSLKLHQMEEVEISQFSVFVGHGTWSTRGVTGVLIMAYNIIVNWSQRGLLWVIL